MSKFLSRKFLLASVFTLTGCGAFAFTTKLTGGEFISLALGILGAFTAGDVGLNYIHRNRPNPESARDHDGLN